MSQYKEVVDFIKSFYGDSGNVLLHHPTFKGNEKKYLLECIDSTFVSSVGKFVDQFEEKVASYTGAKKAVACVNGTNALHLALLLVGVEREDEVITQALTFIATANAIAYTGAKPVFIDVDRDTLGMSPKAFREWLEKNTEVRNSQCYNLKTGKRVKACVPMHTFGHPVRIEEIAEICKEYKIELVEDSAESLGSSLRTANGEWKHTGRFGRVGVFSFNGNKTITTGGGGMLIFEDLELAERAKYITTQAKAPHRWEFVHTEVGYNYRLPNINAALGVAQMEQLDSFLTSKRDIAIKYEKFFETLNKINADNNKETISFFKERENTRGNYWLNVVILKDKKERDMFLEYTNDKGVQTRPLWRLMSSLEMFKDAENDGLENSKWLEERVVNIPSGVVEF